MPNQVNESSGEAICRNKLLMIGQFFTEPNVLFVFEETLANVLVLVQHEIFDFRSHVYQRRGMCCK